MHTPGPWGVGPDCNDDSPLALADVVDSNGHRVATAAVRYNRAVPMGCDETLIQYAARASEAGERYDNARLIAAAPDLLNAVRLLLSNPDNHISRADVTAAQAAIAKAEAA